MGLLQVLAMVDWTYGSRFWTCYEAWLSSMQPTARGLSPVPAKLSRVSFMMLHGATKPLVRAIREHWEHCSVATAMERLSRCQSTS